MNVNDIFIPGGREVKNPNYTPTNGQPEYIMSTYANSNNLISEGVSDAARKGDLNILGSAKELKKYEDYGLTPNDWENLDKQLADKQSNLAKAWNALAQTVVSEIGLGTVKAFSDLADIIINRGIGENNDYTNPVSEQIKEWQEEFKNNVAPIYQDPDETWGDFGWWMNNIPSIASSLTLLIPSTGVAMGLSKIGKALRLTNGVGNVRKFLTAEKYLDKAGKTGKEVGVVEKYLDKLNKATYTPRNWINSQGTVESANRMVNFGINGLTSRILENYQESNQVYSDMLPEATAYLKQLDDDQYAAYVEKHKDQLGDIDTENKSEVAKRIAKVSADETFKDDMWNAVFDVYQLYGLRNLKRFMNGNLLTKVRRAHLNSIKYADKTPEEIAKIVAERPLYKKAGEKVADFLYGSKTQFLGELSEGVEEAVNFIAQEEGMRYGKVLLDKEADDTTFGERLQNYMAAPGLYESAFWGVMGGIVFQNVASLATRAKRSYEHHTRKKEEQKIKQGTSKTNEKINIDESWFLDTKETESRLADVNSRSAARQYLIQQLKQIKAGKDPYNIEASTGKLRDLGTEEEKDAARERAWDDYTHTLLVNSMQVGNFDLTRAFLESEEVKQSFVSAGVISQEEANKRQEEVRKKADELEASYDRNMRAISNAMRGKDEETGVDYSKTPFEYFQIVAFENMQHEHLANLYQKKIDASNPTIQSEEYRLTPKDDSVEENPLMKNGISIKEAIRSFILSEQLGEVESEIEAINKTEKEGKNKNVADNRTIAGQSRLRQLQMRKKVILSMIKADKNMNDAAMAMTVLRAGAATVMNDNGSRSINIKNQRYKDFDKLITDTLGHDLTTLEGMQASKESLAQINKLFKDTGISFKNLDEFKEAKHQANVFNETVNIILDEEGDVIENLDKYSKKLKDLYGIIAYNEIEKNVELAKIAKDRDSIRLNAHARHNESAENAIRAIFVDQQNETLKRIARDYNEKYESQFDDEEEYTPISKVLAYGAFNKSYNNQLRNLLSEEDYKAYEEAVSNLALTKPVNSMLAEFIEDSIEASRTDEFIDVANIEAGLVDEEGNKTKTTAEEDAAKEDDTEKDESSTGKKQTTSAPPTAKPIVTPSPSPKVVSGSVSGKKIDFTTNTKGKKLTTPTAILIANDTTGDITTIGQLGSNPDYMTSADVIINPDNPNVVTMDYMSELNDEDNERDITDEIFTNKQLFQVKTPITNGGTLVSNPIIKFDDDGNIIHITPGIIANPDSVDGKVAASVDNSSTGGVSVVEGEEGFVAPGEEDTNEPILDNISNEDKKDLEDEILESGSFAITDAKLDEEEFDLDEFLMDIRNHYSESYPADVIEEIIERVKPNLLNQANVLDVTVTETKDLAEFISESAKLDSSVGTTEEAKHRKKLDKLLDNILNSYAERAFVSEVDGVKQISLENLLRYCKAITGLDAFANVLYDRFVEQINDSDKYVFVESNRNIRKNKGDILKKSSQPSSTRNPITEKDGKRIGVEKLFQIINKNENISSELKQEEIEKIKDIFDTLKPGDKLDYKIVDGRHIEVSVKGQRIGRLYTPYVEGSYLIGNDMGWKLEIPRSNDGTKCPLEQFIIELFTGTENVDQKSEVISLLNKGIYAKKRITDESGKEVENPIFNEIIDALDKSGIDYKNLVDLSKGKSRSDLGKYLVSLYRHVKTRSDNYLADHKFTRDEYEEVNRDQRIDSIHDWFNEKASAYLTAIRLFQNQNLHLEVDYINQGGLNITNEPRVITEKGIIGDNYKGKIHLVSASITEPGILYYSDGSRVVNPNYSGGSTMVSIPRNQGEAAYAHAYPVHASASHIKGDAKKVYDNVVKEFKKRLSEWSDDPSSTTDAIFNLVEELCSTKNGHNALFRGLKVNKLSNGYRYIEYTKDGKRHFIKFYDSHIVDGKRLPASVIQFPGEKAHAFKNRAGRKAVLDKFTKVLEEQLQYNMDFGYVRGDRALSGVAKRDAAGKFIITIPGSSPLTFDSFESFILDNGLVAVTTESINGKSNFMGIDANNPYSNAVARFRIVEDSTSPVEEKKEEPASEPEPTTNAGDEAKDILENAMEGEPVMDKIIPLMLNGTKLNILKNSGLIRRMSIGNVIFAEGLHVVASYNSKEDTVKVGRIWQQLMNGTEAQREEAFRHFIHENVHRKISSLSKEDKAKFFSAIKEVMTSWMDANKNDGIHSTQGLLTKSDNVTFDKRYVLDDGTITDKGIEEFVCESVTRPELIKRLNSIPVEGSKITNQKIGNTKSKNLLQQILAVISKMFGLNINKGSLLEKEYKLFNEIAGLSGETTIVSKPTISNTTTTAATTSPIGSSLTAEELAAAHTRHDALLENSPVPEPVIMRNVPTSLAEISMNGNDDVIVEDDDEEESVKLDDNIETEMNIIKSRAITDGTFMKAPNGKPTNLNERQWLQVRTKAFINWFGDWINNPKSASKIVDENGEPKVMYHYTESKFDTFDLAWFGQTDPGDNGRGFYITPRSPESDINRYFRDSYGDIVMPVFLNIKNPIEAKTDSDIRYFNRIKRPYKSHKETIKEEIKVQEWVKKDLENKLFGNDKENIKYKNPEYIGTIIEKSHLERVNKKIKNLKEELDSLKEDYDDNEEFNNKITKFEQYDGVTNGEFEVVVPNSNQIKSATDNNGNYSNESDNIYESAKLDSDLSSPVISLADIRDRIEPKNRENFERLVSSGVFELTC